MADPRPGDRLIGDENGEVYVHPAGPLMAITETEVEEDGVRRVYTIPHWEFTHIGRVCSSGETTTLDPLVAETTQEPTEGSCQVTVYDVVVVLALFNAEKLGEQNISADAKYDRKYKAAADPYLDLQEGDLVALTWTDQRFWVLSRLATCGGAACASTTTTTPEPTTTTTTGEPPSTTTTEEPTTTTTTTTLEPPTTTTTTTTQEPLTTTTTTTTQEPGTTTTTTTTTQEPITTTTTTTQEPGSTTTTTTQEPGSTTTSTTGEPPETTTTQEPCDDQFVNVPEFDPETEAVAYALVITADGCLRRVSVVECPENPTTTTTEEA